MFTESDYEKLHQIMAESPEKEELLTRLLHSHRMDISTASRAFPRRFRRTSRSLMESAGITGSPGSIREINSISVSMMEEAKDKEIFLRKMSKSVEEGDRR